MLDDYKILIKESSGMSVIFFWMDGHENVPEDIEYLTELSTNKDLLSVNWYKMQINASMANVNLVQNLGLREEGNCFALFMDGQFQKLFSTNVDKISIENFLLKLLRGGKC